MEDNKDNDVMARWQIIDKYLELCNVPSDIYQHLPTLMTYACMCESIAEYGVRSVVSTYAFLTGLLVGIKDIGDTNKSLYSIDLEDCPVSRVEDLTSKAGINFKFIKGNSLTVDVPEVDLSFIDTWHIYGQLKRELEKMHIGTRKLIILHDTSIDGDVGETIRNGWDPIQQSKDTGIPVQEICKGLWPAVTEFLETHPEWILLKRYTHNNGLTILARVDKGDI